jgi:hypothetical protein
MIDPQTADIGRKVLYHNGPKTEEGIVTSFNKTCVFVRYGGPGTTSAATERHHLTWAEGPKPGWKPGRGQSIDRLYAWIAIEPDGGEGVVGANIPSLGGMVPLIGADGERIESFRPYAEMVQRQTGYPVRLKMFSAGVVIDEIES